MKQQPAPALPPSPLRHASQQRLGNCKKVVSATQRTILANASDERQYFATTLPGPGQWVSHGVAIALATAPRYR